MMLLGIDNESGHYKHVIRKKANLYFNEFPVFSSKYK